MPRDEAILLDVAQAARLVLTFKQGMDKAAFLQDIKTQSAILHQLMVMGEAVNRLFTLLFVPTALLIAGTASVALDLGL